MNKTMYPVVLALLAAGAAAAPAAAQGVPVSTNFFGINYWNNQPNATITADLRGASLRLYRIGGNERNRNTNSARDWSVKENWLPLVTYIKNNLGGEPLVQLPIGLTDAQVTTWVNYFASNGVSYFAIGNEADPAPAVAVYPSLATTSFTLDGLAGPVAVELHTLTGQQVLLRRQEATAPVDITALAAGTYLLTVNTEAGQVLRRKVAKE